MSSPEPADTAVDDRRGDPSGVTTPRERAWHPPHVETAPRAGRSGVLPPARRAARAAGEAGETGEVVRFRQVAMVTFQGMVVAFARADALPATPEPGRVPLTIRTDIRYNVLSLDVDSVSDDLDWDGWRPLELPNEVRPSGMQLINVPPLFSRTEGLAALADAGQPFRVVTNQEHIYLLRQAAGGTLLVNRLRLVRAVSADNPQEVEYVLQPTWEVRFQRSGKPDRPLDDKDMQGYESPDREPFIEPTLELPIPRVAEGRFDAVMLPRQEGPMMCTIAVARHPADPQQADQIDLYELPLDGAGRFLLGGKPLEEEGTGLAPDVSFTLQTPEHAPLALSGRPALVHFLKQERTTPPPSPSSPTARAVGGGGGVGARADDESLLVKRAGRVLLALRAEPPGSPVTLATVELGVATDGTVARPASPLTAEPFGAAPYAAELDPGSFIGLPDVVCGDTFALALWLYPRRPAASPSPAPPRMVVGNPGDDTAPRLALVDDGRLQLSFTDRDGRALTARTDAAVVPPEAWSGVVVDVDASRPAGSRVRFRVNGAVVAHREERHHGTRPNGGPITSLGAPEDGFVGTVDSLEVYDTAEVERDHDHRVDAWPLDSIRYVDAHGDPLDPPETPNAEHPDRPGKVYGAHLVPSTNPTTTGEGGALSFDDRGLSIVAGWFEDLSAYGELRSSPALLSSADGMIHCYFQGRDDVFSVMQRLVETARATFESTWTTAVGPPQTGPIRFVSAQPGTSMNAAKVTIRDAQAGPARAFCDVTLESPSERTETWRAVPRSLVPFALSLNGEAIGDPSDRRLLNGTATYYDASGTRSAAYVALPETSNAALVGFVTRQIERMPLRSVEISPVAGTDAVVDLRLTHDVPRWGDTTLTQTWRQVPARVTELLRVLDGESTTYPYGTSGAFDVPAYSVGAASGVSLSGQVLLFVKPPGGHSLPSPSLIRIVVSGTGSDACTVELDMWLGTLRTLHGRWERVPRDQDLLARTLEGRNPDYDYGKWASHDYRAIAERLVVVPGGTTAQVGNTNLMKPDPVGDLRAYASLFECLVTAPVDEEEVLRAAGKIRADAFHQGATAVTGAGPREPITGGSTLFRTMLVALPDQGSVGLVDDTAAASLVLQGINGGWRNQPDQRTVTFEPTGAVDFSTDEAEAPGIGALTIPGDLTLELWCRPLRTAPGSGGPDQRLVTFARTPPPVEGGERVCYLAGLRDVPSLRTGPATSVRAEHALTTGTVYTWFSPMAAGGTVPPGTVAVLASGPRAAREPIRPHKPIRLIEPTRPLVSIGVDVDGHIRAAFVPDDSAPPIVTEEVVAAGRWYQVALPWTVEVSTPDPQTEQYDFSVELYVDGQPVGSQQWRTTRPAGERYRLVTMAIGWVGPQGQGATLPMRVNEAALFARLLTRAEIGQYTDDRIPDNTPGLQWKWMLLEGEGKRAHNSAATGPGFDATIEQPELPDAPAAWRWDPSGLYTRPVLGHGDNVAMLARDPIIRGWSHLALVHQAGYALDLQGDEWVDCGRGPTTELSDTCTIEAWVELAAPEQGRLPQAVTVVGKGDDYELGVTAGRRPRVSVRARTGGEHDTVETLTLALEGPDPLATGRVHHLVATYEMVSVDVPGDDDTRVPAYQAHMALWVDGARVAWGIQDGEGGYQVFPDVVELETSNAPLELGRTSLYDGARYLRGFLSDTRLWSRVLTMAEIREAYRSRRPPADRAGLVSWWRFNETGGRMAFDVQGNCDGRLSRGDLRVLYQQTSSNRFYVDGRAATPTWLADGAGGYPDHDVFRFGDPGGGADGGSVAGDGDGGEAGDGARGGRLPAGFSGQLDSVRIWSTQLTGEQIADAMHRRLSGTEAHLAGLWSFDSGSGQLVEDATDRGNIGRLVGDPPPVWAVSTAPIGDETEGVRNILGGIPSPVDDVITETPAVVEYADLQRDAYGGVVSVMKRAYASVEDGAAHLVTGYKAGDLEAVYLGQAQSAPTVVGFVEGSPPMPSENQTMPYWRLSGQLLNAYSPATTLTFEEAGQTSYVFNATRGTASSFATTRKAGLSAKKELDISKGYGFETGMLVLGVDGKVGGTIGDSTEVKGTQGANRTTGAVVKMTSGLEPGGAWEPGTASTDWVNPTVGRRYIPANTGMAVVKSRTVDVYASILATTRTMVGVAYVPNPDIPEDVNILTFPIDPQYVKNGTLDGKVGLRNDPDYPDADTRRGSYFRPIEAYALKRRIERDQARLAAYYQQFDVTRTASRLRSATAWDSYRASQRVNESYDWAAHLAKRNIVNTYVWTAAGGTFAEETSTMNVFTESYGSLATRTSKIGPEMSLAVSLTGGGPSIAADFLASGSTEVNVVRSRESNTAFSLHATANPDRFLYAPILGEGTAFTFPAEPTEGKVDGYRFLAFYLAPTLDNFDDLRQLVIDRRWLAESMDASAVALREATVGVNGAWRILYRVTYVSRIPPRFQPVPDESRGPDTEPPANPEYNTLLVHLVEREVGRPNPTPVEIGTAIRKVIGTAQAPEQAPLAGFLPWWPQFLRDAANQVQPAYSLLLSLREDLLGYMVDTYAARRAGLRDPSS